MEAPDVGFQGCHQSLKGVEPSARTECGALTNSRGARCRLPVRRLPQVSTNAGRPSKKDLTADIAMNGIKKAHSAVKSFLEGRPAFVETWGNLLTGNLHLPSREFVRAPHPVQAKGSTPFND